MPAAGQAGDRAAAGWAAVVVESRRPLDEELAARLADDCLGAAEATLAGGGSSLRIFLELDADLDGRVSLVETTLRRAGVPNAEWSIRTEHVADGRWVERYVAGLRPFALGRRFVVDPTGADGDAAADALVRSGRQRLRLVPGRAFGTGEHPTTRLCAVGLERFVRDGARWLDIGCGTGILSLVAARCGALEVLGVDVDGEAVAVAGEVLRANDAPSTVRVVTGGIESVRGRWDGIVVNIESGFVERRAEALAARLAPEGLLLVSGLFAGERREAEQRLSAAGLTLLGAAQDDGWALVVAGGAGR